MKILGTRLVLLTGAIAAATMATLAMNGCSSDAEATDAGSSEETDSAPVPGTDDAATGAVSRDSGTDSTSSDGADGGGDAGQCLDDTDAASVCPGTPQACADTCGQFLPAFKKQVGADVWKCYVAAAPACPDPHANPAADTCFAAALTKACADTTASTFCDTLLANTCPGDVLGGKIDKPQCVKFATGLTQAGRDAFTACGKGNGCNWCMTADAVRWTWFH